MSEIEQVSVMGDYRALKLRVCPEHGDTITTRVLPASCHVCGKPGRMIEVVPGTDHRGAVDALRRIAAYPLGDPMPARETNKIARAALEALGQHGGAVAVGDYRAQIDKMADAIWPLDDLSSDEARDELRRDVERGLRESGILSQLEGAVDALDFALRTVGDPDLTEAEVRERIEGVASRTLHQLGGR